MEHEIEEMKWWEKAIVFMVIILAIPGFFWTCSVVYKYFSHKAQERQQKIIQEEQRIVNLEREVTYLRDKMMLRKYILQMIDCRIAKKEVYWSNVEEDLFCGKERFKE